MEKGLRAFFFLSLCSILVVFPGIRVWDVVSELVCLCTIPSPSNPFALDMRYIKNLPLPDRFLVTGALLSFLDMYVVYGNRDELHYDKGRMSRFSEGGVYTSKSSQSKVKIKIQCIKCIQV